MISFTVGRFLQERRLNFKERTYRIMSKLKISLGCDHIGFSLKEELKEFLITEKNAEIILDPIQTPEDGKQDFTITTDLICRGIQEDKCRLALLICGTGLGYCSVANTYWGIRAAHASDCYTAERARKSLNAHILCIGARVMAPEYAKKVVSAFLDEPFSYDRESSVINLKCIEDFENRRMPKPDHITWSMGFDPADA